MRIPHVDKTANLQMLRSVLPESFYAILDYADIDRLEEIRIRTRKPVQLVYADGDTLLEMCPDESECLKLLECICGHSVASKEKELANGYINVSGMRIGVTGEAVYSDGGIKRYSRISGFNMRLPREIRGCADGLMETVRTGSTLIISRPGAGKTTLVRDAARQLSEDGKKVCIADERGELAGSAVFDLGPRTDITSGVPKSMALNSMIRSMSPDVIVCDEIGGEEDVKALLRAKASGVELIATAHGRNMDEILLNPCIREMTAKNCFDRTVVLERRGNRLEFTVTEAGR